MTRPNSTCHGWSLNVTLLISAELKNNDRQYDSMCIVTDAAILLFADQDADAQTSRSVHRCAQGEGVHVKGDGRPRSGRWIRVALRMHGVIDIEVCECGRGRLWW